MHEQQRQWQNIYAQLNQVKGRNKFTACKERREGCERERERERVTYTLKMFPVARKKMQITLNENTKRTPLHICMIVPLSLTLTHVHLILPPYALLAMFIFHNEPTQLTHIVHPFRTPLTHTHTRIFRQFCAFLDLRRVLFASISCCISWA